MSNILFIDLETTGTKVGRHSILQIAAEYHVGGEKVLDFNQYVQPQSKLVSLGAVRCNKIPVNSYSTFKEPDTIANNFVDFLLKAVELNDGKPLTVCAHNGRFDLNFLETFLLKYNYENLDQIISFRVLDTATIAQFMINAGVLTGVKASLLPLAEYFNCSNLEREDTNLDNISFNFHNAIYDVKVMAKIYYGLQDLVVKGSATNKKAV